MARLREGRANTARGAAHFLRETVSALLTMRADSTPTPKMDVRFSNHPPASLRNPSIPEDAWTPIPYWMDGAAAVANQD